MSNLIFSLQQGLQLLQGLGQLILQQITGAVGFKVSHLTKHTNGNVVYVRQRFKKLLFGPDYYWFDSNYFSLVYLKQLNYNENKDNVKCRSEWPRVWLGFSDWLRCREHLGQPFMLTNTPLTSLKLTLHGCFSTSLQAQREHENSTQKGSSRPIQPSLTLSCAAFLQHNASSSVCLGFIRVLWKRTKCHKDEFAHWLALHHVYNPEIALVGKHKQQHCFLCTEKEALSSKLHIFATCHPV